MKKLIRKIQSNEREEEIKQAIKDICSCEFCKFDKDYCPFCKERNVTVDAINWADQHPREELWDNNKVIKFIKENVREYHKSGVFHLDDFINDLRKAMED